MALSIGLEPTTDRLTADCSAIELAERMTRESALENDIRLPKDLQDFFAFPKNPEKSPFFGSEIGLFRKRKGGLAPLRKQTGNQSFFSISA